MASDHVLRYLIEGTKRPSRIQIRPRTQVDSLREYIFTVEKDYFADLVPASKYLTILKIDMDPNCGGIPLPLLRFNKDDEGVEEVSLSQMISDIWPEPPHNHRIQFFVTYDLPWEYKERQEKLDAAQHVYCTFWGKNLDDILAPDVLQHVPDYGIIKYFTRDQIVSLKLKRLLYKEVVLLVRHEYDVCYKDLKVAHHVAHENESGGGVIVTGQPGIGKTCFLFYLLFCCLSEQRPVAFQVDEIFFLFQDTGVQLFDSSSRVEGSIPDGTWTLSDCNAKSKMPCHTFLAASTMGAWTVHTSSPSQNRSSKWVKEVDAFLYWMEPYSDKEMTALGLIKNLDVERLHKNYRLWGPSARTCITLMDTTRVVAHERSVEVAADEFISNIRQFANIDEMAFSHRLIVAWPTATKRTAYPAFASNYILGFVSRAYAKLDLATRQRFYKAISGHTWFGASAGHIFESGVLLWFRYSPAGELLSCNPAEEHLTGYPVPVLEIPVCGENMKFISKTEDLRLVAGFDLPVCLVPVPQTFPTADAIVLTEEYIITVQMTVASRHDTNRIGFQTIHDGLPSAFREAHTWCHVFVTDTEDKAKSLRKLQVDPVGTKGIHVYSAFIDIDKLDLITTFARADTLKKDIATAADKMASAEKMLDESL